MEKIKWIIVYIWLSGFLVIAYSAEAWSYIYMRQHGSEHPKENLIFTIILLLFIIPIAVILILNTFRNSDKPKQQAEFSWSGLALSVFVLGGHDFLQNRAMNMVNSARAIPNAVNIDNAVNGIIRLYIIYFSIMVGLLFITNFAEKKLKNKNASFVENELESELNEINK